MKHLFAAATVLLVLLTACREAVGPSLDDPAPQFEIADASHGNFNARFHWLPPM